MEITFDTNNLNEHDLKMFAALGGVAAKEVTSFNDFVSPNGEVYGLKKKIYELEKENEALKTTKNGESSEASHRENVKILELKLEVKKLTERIEELEVEKADLEEEIESYKISLNNADSELEQANELLNKDANVSREISIEPEKAEEEKPSTIATKIMYFKNTSTGEVFKVSKGTDVAAFAKKPYEITNRKEFKDYQEALEAENNPKEEQSKIPDSEIVVSEEPTETEEKAQDVLNELLGDDNTDVTIESVNDIAFLIKQFIGDFTVNLETDVKPITKEDFENLLKVAKDQGITKKYAAYELINKELMINPMKLEF